MLKTNETERKGYERPESSLYPLIMEQGICKDSREVIVDPSTPVDEELD